MLPGFYWFCNFDRFVILRKLEIIVIVMYIDLLTLFHKPRRIIINKNEYTYVKQAYIYISLSRITS